MRLYLVSLLLILFSLCGQSRAEVRWNDVFSKIGSADSKIDTKALEQLAVTVDKLKLLDEALGNTIFAVFLDVAGVLEKLPDYYKNAVMNGVLCDFEIDPKAKILKALYDSESHIITDQQHTNEENAIAAFIDCKTDDKKNGCFCTSAPYNPLLYCLAKKAEEIVKKADYKKKTCRDKALSALKEKGTKQLGKAFEISLVESSNVNADEEAQINQLTSSRDNANLLCDALDSEVTDAVKALYASDAVYWTVDAIIAIAMYGPGKSIDVLCSEIPEDKKQAVPFLKCICDKDKGISFCYYYHAAVELKKSGFLNCETKNFDESKSKPKSLGLKDAAGSSPNKDGKSSNPSFAYSLLLTPLTAAAVLLHRN